MGGRGVRSNITRSGGYVIQNSNGTLYIRDSYGHIVQEAATPNEAEEVIRRLESGEYRQEQQRRNQIIEEENRRRRSDAVRDRALAEIRRRLTR